MENISEGLSLIPVKRGGVRRAFEQAHAEALTMLEFAFQWKDLNDHFDSVAGSLKERFESLEAREASLEERARIVESKEKELEPFLQRVEELEREVRIREDRLATVKQQLEECEKERDGKESQLIFKTESLQNVVNSLDERVKELGFVKQEIVEREKKLLSVEESLKICCSKLEIKKKELDSVTKSIEECRKQVGVKDEQKSRTDGIAELKRRKLACSVEDLIDERKKGKVEEGDVSAELELKRKELKLSVASWKRKVKLNKEKHAEIMRLITESSIVLHSKQLELSSVRKRLEETSIKLELTNRRAAGVNALIEEQTRTANMRERDIEERERQFHYQQQQQHHHLHMARMPVSPWMNGSADSYGSADLHTAVPQYGPASATPRNFQMP